MRREGKWPVAASAQTVFSSPDTPPPAEVAQLAQAMRATAGQVGHDRLLDLDAMRDGFNRAYWQADPGPATEWSGLDAIDQRNSVLFDGRSTNFAFRRVAADYRMTASTIVPVIIRETDKARDVIDQLGKEWAPSGKITRLLQRRIAPVPAKQHQVLRRNGKGDFVAKALRGDQFFVLPEPSLHTPDVGLWWERAEVLSADKARHAVQYLTQAALIHIHRMRQDNPCPAKGDALHVVADKGGHKLRGMRRVLSLRLGSVRRNRSDVADLVGFHSQPDGTEGVYPVEYKPGKPKRHRADAAQLCAQAICLERMTSHPLPKGGPYHAQTTRRVSVPFDQALRDLTLAAITELRDQGSQLPDTDRQQLEAASDRMAMIRRRVQASAGAVDAMRRSGSEAAPHFFQVFDALRRSPDTKLHWSGRSRRPPLDPVNALLSFLWALRVHDCRSACETVGLDPAAGFLHRDRPSRPSLTLELMVELLAPLADRLALLLINPRQLRARFPPP